MQTDKQVEYASNISLGSILNAVPDLKQILMQQELTVSLTQALPFHLKHYQDWHLSAVCKPPVPLQRSELHCTSQILLVSFTVHELPTIKIEVPKGYEREVKTWALLWWYIWRRTSTSVGVVWFASNFCNLPNLEQSNKWMAM